MPNSRELFDFGGDVLKPAHRCSPSSDNSCETYRELQEVETKVTHMKQTLEALMNVCRGLRTKMNDLHDPFLCRVPLEVATTIFRFCLPTEIHPIYWPFILGKRKKEEYNACVLFTLGGVSKSWRQIIWSTPQFWSHLSICIKPTTLLTSITIAKDWIDRSARIPLSIQVSLSTRFDEGWATELNEEVMNDVKTLTEVINACSTRWESLDLRLPANLYPMFHGQPSNLRELRMDNYTHWVRVTEPCLLAGEGSNKPTPTYVSFDLVQIKSLDISWSNVTHVDATGIDMQECVELLRQAPQLIECSFGMIKPHIVPWNGSGDVLHNGLQFLKIMLPTAGFEDEALDHFILPSLKSLAICLYEAPLPVQNILSLLERSSCKLRFLDIAAVFEEETLLLLLRKIPSLWQLGLKPCMCDHEFSAEGLFKLLARTSLLREEQNKDENEKQQHASPFAKNNAERVEPVEHSSNPSISDSDEHTHKDMFLPELGALTYHQFRREECERIWDLIPGAFGYKYRKEEDFDPQLSIRPLRSLVVNLNSIVSPTEGSIEPPGYISQSTLVQMKELMENGCIIDVWVGLSDLENFNWCNIDMWVGLSERENFIARSIAFHSVGLQV